jgi:hypothetical protein
MSKPRMIVKDNTAIASVMGIGTRTLQFRCHHARAEDRHHQHLVRNAVVPDVQVSIAMPVKFLFANG